MDPGLTSFALNRNPRNKGQRFRCAFIEVAHSASKHLTKLSLKLVVIKDYESALDAVTFIQISRMIFLS